MENIGSMIQLLINGQKYEFKELHYNETIGEVATLTGKVPNLEEDIDLNMNVGLLPYFTGFIVYCKKDPNYTEFIAYQHIYKLKGYIPPLDHYNKFKIDHIFNGIQDKDLGTIEFDPHEARVGITKTRAGDEFNNKRSAILVGTIKDGIIRERISLRSHFEEDSEKFEAYSKYNEGMACNPHWMRDSWNSIFSWHIEDEHNRPVALSGITYLKQFSDTCGSATTLCSMGTGQTFAATQDSNGHYSNGLLYNTPFTVSLDIDSNIRSTGYYHVKGTNILEIIQQICKGPVYTLDDFQMFQARMWMDNNTIYLRQRDEKVNETLRFNKEILSYKRSISISQLTNSVGIITNKNVISRTNDISIDKYGKFESIMEMPLDDNDAYVLAKRNISMYSTPEDVLTVTTHKDLSLGNKVYIPDLGYYTVQEVTKDIYGSGKTINEIVLSEYIPYEKWFEIMQKRKSMDFLFRIYLRGGSKKLSSKHKNYELFKVLRGNKHLITWDSISSRRFTTSTVDDHSHNIDVGVGNAIGFDQV